MATEKIDSNVTACAIAEETSIGVLPVTPVWHAQEPNSYSDFGGDVATTARNTINASRQNQKGSATGLKVTAGFNSDFTHSNMIRNLQGFMFADAREQPSSAPLNVTANALTSVATSDDSYNAAAGLGSFVAKNIVLASGFTNANNNGLKHVVTAATGKVTVSENLTDEASPPAAAKIEAVGVEFATSDAVLALTASVAAVKASVLLTITTAQNAAAGDEIVIGDTAYTFEVSAALPYQIKIGTDRADTCANITAAVNGAAGSGTLYGTGTAAHPNVSVVDNANGTVTFSAKVAGTAGNAIQSVENGTYLAFATVTLLGGTDASGTANLSLTTSTFDLTTLGLCSGQWVYLGGDTSATQFGSSLNGYCRIDSIAAHAITFDDVTFAPAAGAGTGKTVRMWFGTVIQNEGTANLIKTRSYQIERQLGDDANGTQAEYAVGSVPNEFTLKIPLQNKLECDLNYVPIDIEFNDGLTGVKSGTRVAAPGEEALNSSSDLYRMKLYVLDATTSAPTSLFGYATDASIMIKNGVTPVNVLGLLGAVDVSLANFTASGSLTALFTTVAAAQAVRDSADVAINGIFASQNKGFVFDLPLVSLGGGKNTVTKDKPITMPLTAEAGQNAHGYTMSTTFFKYLPDIAMP